VENKKLLHLDEKNFIWNKKWLVRKRRKFLTPMGIWMLEIYGDTCEMEAPG
jgi:hypothetical protein